MSDIMYVVTTTDSHHLLSTKEAHLAVGTARSHSWQNHTDTQVTESDGECEKVIWRSWQEGLARRPNG